MIIQKGSENGTTTSIHYFILNSWTQTYTSSPKFCQLFSPTQCRFLMLQHQCYFNSGACIVTWGIIAPPIHSISQLISKVRGKCNALSSCDILLISMFYIYPFSTGFNCLPNEHIHHYKGPSTQSCTAQQTPLDENISLASLAVLLDFSFPGWLHTSVLTLLSNWCIGMGFGNWCLPFKQCPIEWMGLKMVLYFPLDQYHTTISALKCKTERSTVECVCQPLWY